MADDPLAGTPPLRLWALLDAHMLCVIASGIAAEGWLIDGVSIQLQDSRDTTPADP